MARECVGKALIRFYVTDDVNEKGEAVGFNATVEHEGTVLNAKPFKNRDDAMGWLHQQATKREVRF